MQDLKIFKVIFSIFLFIIFFIVSPSVFSANNSFVTIVNPVRGPEFWEEKSKPTEVIEGQIKILREQNIPATWLIRFDALKNKEIKQSLDGVSLIDEKGLFLEITPIWTSAAGVKYNQSVTWHSAGSVFLSGYSQRDREKLIDTAFAEFKQVYGFYPKSVGAWWIDNYSLQYMQQKYGVFAALIVADQYTTDNYQIWGQYWSYPYYPARGNNLIPAQKNDEKIPVVISQWAPRDPVNGYGGGVQESTYSLQANDYIDYHSLNSDYFSKLIDVFTQQKFNQVNQVVVGLENSYSWQKYGKEYENQINILKDKRSKGQLSLLTMGNFASWYQTKFTGVSPEQIIVTKDPLETERFSIWFMNPYYRVGWFSDKEESSFRDVRQYIVGQEEPCFKESCNALNFATFSTRVLDDVTYKQKLILERGRIKDIKVEKNGEDLVISYINQAGIKKQIKFLPRDIEINKKNLTVDALILQALNLQQEQLKIQLKSDNKLLSFFQETFINISFKTISFLLFIFTALFIPGFILVRFLKIESTLLNIFLAVCIGLVSLTLVSFVGGYLKIPWLTFIYIGFSFGFFFLKKLYRELKIKLSINESPRLKSRGFFLSFSRKERFIPALKRARFSLKDNKFSLIVFILIISGTVFQSLSMIRSGWVYDFGMGFWGPTGHDGIWHQALISQLINKVPPENPAFSGNILSNYHYFYDLLVAVTYSITKIPVLDLLYRFYPILLSLLLGIGTFILASKLLKNKIAAVISLYFVYFSGSFGWIVEYLREKHFGGESAFWVNQPVSMNLNPPFAISLILLIAIILTISAVKNQKNFVAAGLLILLVGSMIEFKVYAGIIILGSLFLIGLHQLISFKDWFFLMVFFGSFLFSMIVFLPQNSTAGDFLVLSPLWFVHSMVDFPDRVGWLRLSQAREAYLIRQEWLKYFYTESLGLMLFIVGNLGTRFIALFALITFIKRKLWLIPEYAVIFLMAISSIIIPLIFVQKGNPWNTIQFAYYFLYFVALFTGLVLFWFYKKLPRILSIPVLIFILILTPINAVVTFSGGLSQSSPSKLSGGELTALSFLKGQPMGVVLTPTFDKNLRSKLSDPFPLLAYETTSYVAAFSGKPSYLEDEIQQEILQNDYKKRIVSINDFFLGRDISWSKQFLSESNIRYIYLPKIYQISLDIEKLNLKNIYENDEVQILQKI